MYRKAVERSRAYNESSEQVADLISVEVKIGLLVGKTNQVERSALLCEGPAEEVVLFVMI
jgi:hypothetical protein